MKDHKMLATEGKAERLPMQMEEFVIIMMEELKNRFGSDSEVRVNEVKKNNGVIFTGVSVFKQGKNIAPTVYMEKMLARYNAGDSLEDITDEIVRIMSNAEMEGFDVEKFLDWNNVKGRICYRLINRRLNEDMLKDVPHRKFLDLEIVYYYKLKSDTVDSASILVKKRFLDEWKVTEQSLYEAAVKNTARRNPYEVVSMQKMLRNMFFQELKTRVEADDAPDWNELEHDARQMAELNSSDEMFVLSNRDKYFGASCLLYNDVLKKIARELEDDLIILPSSVHETILLRASNCENTAALKLMVEEVNQSQVKREERLSDSVYMYERNSDRLSILMGDVEELSEAI